MAARLATLYGPLGFVRPKRFLPLNVIEGRAIAAELKKINFQPAKRIYMKFDPFDEKVKSVREFCYYTSAERYRSTNTSCIFKTEVCSDRSEPLITITLAESDRQLIFKTKNLSAIELLQLFNKHVSSLYQPPKESADSKVMTKSMAKSAAKGTRK